MAIKRYNHGSIHYLIAILAIVFRNVFYVTVWGFIALVGIIIFKLRRYPYDVAIGLPLFLVGLGFVVHCVWSILLVMFSPVFNKAICFICRKAN